MILSKARLHTSTYYVRMKHYKNHKRLILFYDSFPIVLFPFNVRIPLLKQFVDFLYNQSSFNLTFIYKLVLVTDIL